MLFIRRIKFFNLNIEKELNILNIFSGCRSLEKINIYNFNRNIKELKEILEGIPKNLKIIYKKISKERSFY